jgi:small-conductance mechanosensitive channel
MHFCLLIGYGAGGVNPYLAYESAGAMAREGLLGLARDNPRVRAMPAPEVIVSAIGESTVTLQLRVWSAARDHASVQAELMESLLADYARRGIRAPLPRREVHVFHHDDPGGSPDALDEVVKPAL